MCPPMSACKSYCHHRQQSPHKISLFEIRFSHEITLALSGAGRLCSIVRLSAGDVQLLNSVRTKFICKISYFYSIQRISARLHQRLYADTIEYAWTAPKLWCWSARTHTHTQSSPRSGRQFITNTSYTFAWHYVSSRCSLLPYFDWSAPENIYACIRICETEWASGCGIHRESNSFCIQSYCVVGILFCFFSLLLFVCHHGSCGVPAIKWISSVRFSGAEDASVLCETIRQCLIRGLYRNEIISNSIP